MSDDRKIYRTLLTPLRFLERSGMVYADKTAVVYNEKKYSYRDLSERVNRMAAALRDRGLKPGDRVAFLCPNTPPMLEAHFGVLLAGGILVPINIRLSSKEMEFLINHSGAAFLFADTEFAGTLAPIINQLEKIRNVVNIQDLPDFSPLAGEEYEAFLLSGSPEPWLIEVEDEEGTISINYTSGTTGNPKGVMYTHRGAYLNALGEGFASSFTSETVYLWTLPMFHCNGWCCPWGITALGATHVCLRYVDAAEIWRLINKEGVSHLNGAPIVLSAMMNHSDRPERLKKQLTITTAAAPPSPTLIEQVRAIGARVVHVYGLTETYGPYTVCETQSEWQGLSTAEQAIKFSRQGVAYVVADPVRVVDENMHDVPADGKTLGEVLMRGNNVMKGYYRDPEKTAEAFRGQWFHSGDLAVMHPDNYIELKDRSKDIIISGGENISSIEVEQAIYRNPAVLEVAVIGIPHEKWGETVKAFVSLKEGCSLNEKELIEFCRNEIARYKCPTSVEFADIPKTVTGKIQKFRLREKEWAGHERKI